MAKLLMKPERTAGGHWWGFFAGENKSVVVEGSLAESDVAAKDYVLANAASSEGESEREITDKETGVVSKIKTITYFYGDFGGGKYNGYTVNEIKVGTAAKPLIVKRVALQ